MKIDEVLQLDGQRRKLLSEVEQFKSLRHRVSKGIGALMSQKKRDGAEARKKAAEFSMGETMSGTKAVAQGRIAVKLWPMLRSRETSEPITFPIACPQGKVIGGLPCTPP